VFVTTTSGIDGRSVKDYLGIVSGEAIMGTNIFRDMFAAVRDIVGGRSLAYEKELKAAKELALEELQAEAGALGAQAIVGVSLDYEVVGGDKRTLLMVSAVGTAVTLDSGL
jgi:uncharacterized protein YbjQ (UPF0145 family)